MKLTIYLVRHGKTMFNTTGRIQGWSDSPITPMGAKKVNELGERMADVPLDAVYSSDAGRAVETAEIVLSYNRNKKKIASVSRKKWFREINFGYFEGRNHDYLLEKMLDFKGITHEEYEKNKQKMTLSEFITWSADTVIFYEKEKKAKPEETWFAESFQTVAKRMKEGLNKVVEQAIKDHHETILIVSHGMSLAALFSVVEKGFVVPRGSFDNASLSKITYDGEQYKIEVLGDQDVPLN